VKEGEVAGTHGEGERCLRGFGCEAQMEEPSVSPRSRWEDNIKMKFRETVMDGENWIRPAQDRVQWRAFVNTVMNIRVP
jgi:hypothetical protein